MPTRRSPYSSPAKAWAHKVAEYLHTYPDNHPTQIALRTHVLALFLSLGPAFAAFLANPRRKAVGPLVRTIQRELGPTGFAFAMTTAMAGGAALKSAWTALEERKPTSSSPNQVAWFSRLQDVHKTFLANALSAFVAILLLQHQRLRSKDVYGIRALPIPYTRPSATLDLTMLLLVRALDVVMRLVTLPIVKDSDFSDPETQKYVIARRRTLAARIDACAFWASSARCDHHYIF
jgi:hypothetical protein